ncbi:MAG: acylphosphatase [Candidatus Methanoperedens sp.]|nr:acylphosphatase [Candidatus Methanoperedens sp.]MCZ7396208.1 acylphosphatase [Candidatus Methanoperedens sp.]
MNIRVHVFISGKVQGVFFRSSTKDQAEELSVSGWVRNLADGRVEAVFEGEEGNVRKMIEWCRRGPEYARVEDVGIVQEQYKGELKGFALRR